MGAIFPSGIAIGCEGLSAVGADEAVHSFSVDSFRVAVPPSCAAFVGAEFDLLSAGDLMKQTATVQTESGIKRDAVIALCFDAGQSFFPTKGDNGIFLNPHSFCDGCVSVPLPAKGSDLLFL